MTNVIPPQDAIAAIVESYRDMSHLREIHDEYRRRGQEHNRQGYLDCRRVFRYQRLLDDGEENEHGENVQLDMNWCQNCNRRQSNNLIHEGGDGYRLVFLSVGSNMIKRRKFKTFSSTVRNPVQVVLCQQCHNYLVIGKKEDDKRNVWPAFIWKLLSNPDTMEVYSDNIWKLIPRTWRFWFIDSLKEGIAGYQNISMATPNCQIIDMTMEMKHWEDLLGSNDLPQLAQACNNYLTPRVLCPFGCSEFTHKVGYMPMDIVFQRFLLKTIISTYTDRNAFDNAISARDDFLEVEREKRNPEWLFNEKWTVMPSILFVEGEPKILTCADHDGGLKGFKLHLCRQPLHNLSPPKSDQLCHAVLRTRTIRPLRKSTYSDSFEMHEQRGSFNGIDTCNITTYHDFGSRSKLLSEAESRSLMHRPDINALLSQFVEQNHISKVTAENKRKLAEEETRRQINCDCTGGSFVPIEVAMMIQAEEADDRCNIILDDRVDLEGNLLPEVIVKGKKFWAVSLFPCQKMCKWGAIFPTCPTYNSKGTNLEKLWIVSGLMIGLEPLWRIVGDRDHRKSQWHGWVLLYLTKTCRSFSPRMNNIYCWKYVSKVDSLKEKLPPGSFCDLLDELDRVKCIDLFIGMEQGLSIQEIIDQELMDNIQDDVIIMFQYYGDLMKEIEINGIKFELRIVTRTWVEGGHKWNGEIWARHGGMFPNWWYQRRKDPMMKQINGEPQVSESCGYILGYAREQKSDVEGMRNKFLKNIGGQFHVQCERHKLPLICSTERSNKCQCGKREYLKCSVLMCSVNTCRACFNEYDENCITYLEEHVGDTSNDGCDDSSSESTDRNEMLESMGGNLLERDDFENYITSTLDPDVMNNEEDEIYDPTSIPMSNAGELAFEVAEDNENKGAFKDITVNGYTLMNQCGTLLTRKNHELKASTKQKFFLQKICSTSNGISIPLLYPEAMLFPSIYWKSADDKCSLVGAVPAPLLTDGIKKYGFEELPTHIRGNLTSPLFATNTNPRYTAFCYDIHVNLAANREDTRCIISHGLSVADEKVGGLGLRGEGDSSLLNSVDNKAMVRNLCSSQRWHRMDVFLTFTCNMKKHFGTKIVKKWVDSGVWKKRFPNYYDLDPSEKEEIDQSVLEASSSLLQRIWQEVCHLFLKYVKNSPKSPYKSVRSIFARYEYQKCESYY